MALTRMADQIGRVLGGRYRLVAPIGSGASAQVFLADDVRLRRRVAVKLLHPGLAEDEAFLKRFRAEAAAAAALSNAHIVSIYDWGEEDEPFIVCELLAGGSLRSMLDAGRRLSLAQTLMVGLEAARGLDHAHRRGIVHRDIKPANLLFAEDGRLAIADFGLARALADAAWTEPSGSVMGTARYASPEQAKGQAVDGKADVYALGLVLVEAVTSEVPFWSDTTIATLMARTERDVEVPERLGALVPVLQAAGRVDPTLRPDAAGFAAMLVQASEDLDRPEPLPLVGAVKAMPPDPVERQDGRPVRTGDLDPTPTPGPLPHVPADDTGEASAGPVAGTRKDKRAQKKASKEAHRIARGDGEPRRWPRHAAIGVVSVLIVAIAGFGVWRFARPSHEVPELVGLGSDEVGALVEGNGWDVQREVVRRDDSEAGVVISQSPGPGESLREGEPLEVTVSLGNELVEVPRDLTELPLAEAQARLEEAGLTVGQQRRKFAELLNPDVVMAVAGRSTMLPRGSAVDLVVSQGPRPRTIPSGLEGQSYDQAAAAITDAQLVPVRGEDYSDTVAEGQVIRTEPGGGEQVARDSEVRIVVSLGPELIAVPNVSGDSVADATAALEAAGFEVQGVSGSPSRPVVRTDPGAGSMEERGTAVSLITGGGGDD
jgi:beta-lactam-binding protein with PASTA domain/tRNA A-37 threonylcarbamoyl transferase component Bud32